MPRPFLLLAALALFGMQASAQDSREPSAILELGAAAQSSLTDGGTGFGPSLAIETTPIEDWLEIEAGVTPSFSAHQTEWSADFLFKKPYTLSDTLEFMAGLGPEWDRSVSGGHVTDALSAEAALDFMYWPWPERRFGLYLEPSYDYSFGKGHEQSLGASVGLLIPIP